ncbi:MAG: aldehyde dehydrogenase family protein [Parcubacteria group bacterium]|nr:aldehyde dehydrogenase family protein [Parcubacteria group bacterium]
MKTVFTNAPNTLWNGEEEKKMRDALYLVRRRLLGGAFSVPLIIGGNECGGEEIFLVRNPGDTDERLARVSFAGEREAAYAAEFAYRHRDMSAWSKMSFEGRGLIFSRAAWILCEQRYFFMALLMLEVGKTASEASGEVAEAIDMLRYYPESAASLLHFVRSGIQSPAGEKNIINLRPSEKFPLALVISPWNFPLAIALGMTVAALVAGYSVIFKPAEESSIIGYFLARLLLEAGVPKGILQFVPGRGEVAGKALVSHRFVKGFGFTGSAAVAREIAFSIAKWNYEIAPTLLPDECDEKHFLTKETGGNGFIIVDSSTNVQTMIPDAVTSAISGSGQKCSSGQRFIVVDDQPGTYEKIVAPLRCAFREIRVGSPENFGNTCGPVISREAHARITELVASAKRAGARVTESDLPKDLPKGNYVAASLIEGPSSEDPLVQEEIFGPVLFVLRAQTIEEAVEMANYSRYGLTGGICSRNEAYIAYAVENLDVVNCYVNRQITGAVVGRQPFGGYGKSGSGFKAGGPLYLANFLGEQVISINTMRQGIPLDTK